MSSLGAEVWGNKMAAAGVSMKVPDMLAVDHWPHRISAGSARQWEIPCYVPSHPDTSRNPAPQPGQQRGL
jgi:hypothetical protein